MSLCKSNAAYWVLFSNIFIGKSTILPIRVNRDNQNIVHEIQTVNKSYSKDINTEILLKFNQIHHSRKHEQFCNHKINVRWCWCCIAIGGYVLELLMSLINTT